LLAATIRPGHRSSQSDWNAEHLDATPVAEAPFQQGVAEYHLPIDLYDQPRKANAAIHNLLVWQRPLIACDYARRMCGKEWE
jgi:predicted  nucleic acid-binding Zn ribbon protein